MIMGRGIDGYNFRIIVCAGVYVWTMEAYGNAIGRGHTEARREGWSYGYAQTCGLVPALGLALRLGPGEGIGQDAPLHLAHSVSSWAEILRPALLFGSGYLEAPFLLCGEA
jgi:hypothetical protein